MTHHLEKSTGGAKGFVDAVQKLKLLLVLISFSDDLVMLGGEVFIQVLELRGDL